jgi:aminoglycoside phosphotransferase
MPIVAMVTYKVAPKGKEWLVTRDGVPGMSYVSQEAAYEVAVAEAAGDLRTGHEVRIEVVGRAYDRLGDGSRQPIADNLAQG